MAYEEFTRRGIRHALQVITRHYILKQVRTRVRLKVLLSALKLLQRKVSESVGNPAAELFTNRTASVISAFYYRGEVGVPDPAPFFAFVGDSALR